MSHRLPEALRSTLAVPMGRLYSPDAIKGKEFTRLVMEAPFVITVGDRVTETLGAMGRVPELQVVDSKENRKSREPPKVAFAKLLRTNNPAGTLTDGTIEAVREALKGPKPARVLVEGEEDLVAVPVIVMAPFAALVLYGQPGEGVVAVRADAAAKSRSRDILSLMGIRDLS